MLKPLQDFPDFSATHLSKGPFKLSSLPAQWRVIIVYRGYHCPVCRRYLQQIDAKVADFHTLGFDLVVLSTDSHERALKSTQDWGLKNIDLAYGLAIAEARSLGLFISRAIHENEPEWFGEPALFIIQPDGKLFAASIQTMPFTRPAVDELIGARGGA